MKRWMLIISAVALGTGFAVDRAIACGWWGDGEQSDHDAVLVDRHGQIVGGDATTIDDPDRMFLIAEELRLGKVVSKDEARALYWYRQAALQGHAGAQFNLGRVYDLGLGVDPDATKAAYWYRLSAQAGDMHAQHHLSDLYREGRGVEQDARSAHEWMLRSAMQGHADVFTRLALNYWLAEGVDRDPTQVYHWSYLAVQHDDERAGNLCLQASVELNKEVIAALQQVAHEWMRRWRGAAWNPPLRSCGDTASIGGGVE